MSSKACCRRCEALGRCVTPVYARFRAPGGRPLDFAIAGSYVYSPLASPLVRWLASAASRIASKDAYLPISKRGLLLDSTSIFGWGEHTEGSWS